MTYIGGWTCKCGALCATYELAVEHHALGPEHRVAYEYEDM